MATATQARQQEQMQQLLAGLSAVRGGDFSTRLPDGQDPLMNEIAAVFKVAFARWISAPGQPDLPGIFRESMAELRGVLA